MGNNGSMLSMLDSFIESVELTKRASEPTTALHGTNDAGAGKKPIVEGQRSKEHTKDINKRQDGISDLNTYPAPIANSGTGTVGTTDADQAPQLKPKKQPGVNEVFNKVSSLKSLGDSILENMKKQAAAPAPAPVAPAATPAAAPVAAPAPQVDMQTKVANITKRASDDAEMYSRYLISYSKQLSKQANEDAEGELLAATADAGVTPGAMDATMGNTDGALTPEDLALLNELEAQGVSLEDLAALLAKAEQGGGMEEPGMEMMAEGMPQEDVDTAVMAADDVVKAASILKVRPVDLFASLYSKGK